MNTEDKHALEKFGQAVRQSREQQQMSVSQLSDVSRLPRGRKMSARRIGRIEAGEVDPHFDELIALADALGITPGILINDAERL